MSKCEYVPVQKGQKDFPELGSDEDRSWKPFLRQLVISSAIWCQYFQFGLCFGTPTVVIPRMRAEMGQDYVSPEMASWMSSAIAYGAIPWPIVMAILASYVGRRYTFAFAIAAALVGFTLLAIGTTPMFVLISMAVQGLLLASQMTVSLLVMTEYTSPQHRGIFLTIKSASVFWGVWVANAIGAVAHWRYIAWLGLACCIYSAATLVVWPESPYWLASRGRYAQCARAQEALKGHTASSQKELQELIKGHHDCIEDKSGMRKSDTWRQVWFELKSKSFYKPLLICLALAWQYQFSGKLVCTVYAIDIIKDITKSEHAAYRGMLILDGVTVLSMYVGCGLSRVLPRKALLLIGGGAANVFLLALALYLRLAKANLVLPNNYVTVGLLIAFSISVCCGPMILNSTLIAELLPLRLRSFTTAVIAVLVYIVLSISLKVAPYIFTTFGMDGAFLFYGLVSSSLLVVLYMYLPETKDKTLKEIEQLIIGTQIDDHYAEQKETMETSFEKTQAK